MNELTIHGNVTAAPELRFTASGTAVANFSVAVNRSRFDRNSGEWVQQKPVYHRVVVWKQLAENAAETLSTGSLVTVTGYQVDNSWERNGETVRDVRLEASDVAASLRFATATLTRTSGRTTGTTETATERVAEPVTEPIAAQAGDTRREREDEQDGQDEHGQDGSRLDDGAEEPDGRSPEASRGEEIPAARARAGRAGGRRRGQPEQGTAQEPQAEHTPAA